MAFLKKVNVPDEARKTAFAATAMSPGQWVKLNGEFSAGDITSLGSSASNKPGYASVGDKKLTLITTSDDNITGRVAVVDKLVFIPEDSDTDSNAIAAGQSCVYYTEGQFETDQYTSVSGTGAAFGDYLKPDDNSKLQEEASASTETTKSIARVIKINNSGDSTKDSLVFEMIK